MDHKNHTDSFEESAHYEQILIDWLKDQGSMALERVSIGWDFRIGLVCFKEMKHWGQFDPVSNAIYLSKDLLRQNYRPYFMEGVYLHELAHAVMHYKELKSGIRITDHHGLEFASICKQMGIPNEFRGSQLHLEGIALDFRRKKMEDQDSKLLARIEKLLALAGSQNEHEAALALSKVQELYTKLNYEKLNFLKSSDLLSIVIVTKTTVLNRTDSILTRILKNYFFVESIIGYEPHLSKRGIRPVLVFYGTQENLLMAEYVYHFLNNELVRRARSQKGKLVGRSQINSYKIGLLLGFEEKLAVQQEQLRKQQEAAGGVTTALVNVTLLPILDAYIHELHPSLRQYLRSPWTANAQGLNAGRQDGKTIQLNKPVESESTDSGRLLS
jgi:hypothetical protein